jgi:hypothetical protein
LPLSIGILFYIQLPINDTKKAADSRNLAKVKQTEANKWQE